MEESLKLALLRENKNQSEEENEKSDEDSDEGGNDNVYLWMNAIQEGLDEEHCPGIIFHLADIFVESILLLVVPKDAPVADVISDEQFTALLLPFYEILKSSEHERIRNRVINEIFLGILNSKFDEPPPTISPETEPDELTRHLYAVSQSHRFFKFFSGISEALFSIAADEYV